MKKGNDKKLIANVRVVRISGAKVKRRKYAINHRFFGERAEKHAKAFVRELEENGYSVCRWRGGWYALKEE